MISNPKLYVRLEAFHRLSDEYRNAITALRVARDLIIKGTFEQEVIELRGMTNECSHGHDCDTYICIRDLVQKVKDLEEWRKEHYSGKNGNYVWVPNDKLQQQIQSTTDYLLSCDKKVIDKKVWEDIKDATNYLRNCLLKPIKDCHPTIHLHELEDAIKKADPSWCKDD